ncbi:hypothetical protein NIES208_14825 [[Limnothrix rosea] IAM M-220]|nr:hypothetical protein NIES208_14825 [[Limnothrix rosea] IAM M-220]
MSLENEIEQRSAEVKSDSYSMSIGELVNLYQDHEIDIHPEFQRFYRWSSLQKTKLIESILLGIPLPPIFVSQRKDGVWDVVDGLQRLSTIFQFMGILIGEDEKRLEPLVLEETKYLPSLKDKLWSNPEDPENSFTKAQQLFIKRSKLDVKIILKESDEKSKYELFQRLNTGGSPLSEQEIRNCILVMENREMFLWLQSLCNSDDFQECLTLTDRAKEEKYDMDLALRFVVFRKIDAIELKKIKDINEFVTDKMLEIARNEDFDFEEETEAFNQTFYILKSKIGQDCFHRYDINKERFLGGFLLSAFETIALGIAHNYEEILEVKETFHILERIKELWSKNNFLKSIGSGKTASLRMPKIVPLGRKLFKP